MTYLQALTRSLALACLAALCLGSSCAPPPAGPDGPSPEATAADGEGEAVAATGISKQAAIDIARKQFDFAPLETEVEAVKEAGKDAWKVTLRGHPPGPKSPIGQFGEVVIDRETGDILSLSQS